MALSLCSQSSAIGRFCRALSLDPDIQDGVIQLAMSCRECIGQYHRMLKNEGDALLVQKVILSTTENPADVEVFKLLSALEAIIVRLKEIRGHVVEMETGVHDKIELCRSRQAQHNHKVLKMRQNASVLEEDMLITEEEKSELERDISVMLASAAEMEQRVSELKRAAHKRKSKDVVNAIVGGVGIVLAPFTAGLSLALVDSAGILTGVNLNSERECREAVKKVQEQTQQKLTAVERMGQTIERLRSQNLATQEEVNAMHRQAEAHGEARQSLEQMTGSLLHFVSQIDMVLAVFQELDICFKEALLETDAFTVIRRAFGRNPEKISSTAQARLDKLKSTWDAVERILVNPGMRGSADTPRGYLHLSENEDL